MRVSTDIVLFSVLDSKLMVLVTKRDEKSREGGKWALPGGVLNEDQTSEKRVSEVLSQKLKVYDNLHFEQFKVFDSLNRDPDDRSISIGYLALVNNGELQIQAGEKVSEVNWVSVSELPNMAFDHNEIVNSALVSLRKKLRTTDIGFNLVSNEFTIPQLREVFEVILGKELNSSNFRTKLQKMNIFNLTGKKVKNGRGQPAPVYSLKKSNLSQVLNDNEVLFN